MSFESLSSENRNNQMSIPLHRRVQCCSFCRQPGHNITTCNSDRLLEFEVICADVVRNFHNPDDFKNWLRENYGNNLILLRAFTIRKFPITSTNTLNTYIDHISEYIFRTYKNNIPIEEEIYDDLPDLIEADENPENNDNLLLEMLIGVMSLINNRDSINYIPENYNLTIEYIRYISYMLRNHLPQQNQRNITLRIEENVDENIDEECQCSICWENKELKQFIKLGCDHEFCKDCIKQSLTISNSRCCALCRNEVVTMRIRNQEVHDEICEIV